MNKAHPLHPLAGRTPSARCVADPAGSLCRTPWRPLRLPPRPNPAPQLARTTSPAPGSLRASLSLALSGRCFFPLLSTVWLRFSFCFSVGIRRHYGIRESRLNSTEFYLFHPILHKKGDLCCLYLSWCYDMLSPSREKLLSCHVLLYVLWRGLIFPLFFFVMRCDLNFLFCGILQAQRGNLMGFPRYYLSIHLSGYSWSISHLYVLLPASMLLSNSNIANKIFYSMFIPDVLYIYTTTWWKWM